VDKSDDIDILNELKVLVRTIGIQVGANKNN